MPTKQANSVPGTPGHDPYKRHKTRWPGIYYREKQDGSRSYSVHHEGRWHPVKSGGEKEARALQAYLRGLSAQGERVATGKKTYGEWEGDWFATKRNLRDHTREGYESVARCHLNPRFGNLRVGEVDADRVAALIADMHRDGYSESMKRNTLIVLKGVLDLAARRNAIPANPMSKLTVDERRGGKPPKERRFLDHEEVGRLLDGAAGLTIFSTTPLAADELRDAIYILVYTGLRAGELLALRRCDVDLAQGLLHVRHSLTRARELGPTKTPSSVRDLVLDEHVDNTFRGQLERMLARGQGRPEDFLWTHKKGGPLGYTSLRCLFVRARKAAGLDAGVVLHSTRHTYASWAILEAEARVEFLSKQMGHKNISETWDTYFHFFLRAEHAEKTRERLSAAIHW